MTPSPLPTRATLLDGGLRFRFTPRLEPRQEQAGWIGGCLVAPLGGMVSFLIAAVSVVVVDLADGEPRLIESGFHSVLFSLGMLSATVVGAVLLMIWVRALASLWLRTEAHQLTIDGSRAVVTRGTQRLWDGHAGALELVDDPDWQLLLPTGSRILLANPPAELEWLRGQLALHAMEPGSEEDVPEMLHRRGQAIPQP